MHKKYYFHYGDCTLVEPRKDYVSSLSTFIVYQYQIIKTIIFHTTDWSDSLLHCFMLSYFEIAKKEKKKMTKIDKNKIFMVIKWPN